MANTKFTRAVKKAKGLYKTGRYKTFGDAVKAAYKKVGSVGSVKKKNRQTGTSKRSADNKRKAKAPGKRRSASGRKYTERRKNRSDVPGRLTGVSAGTLKSELLRRKKAEFANALLRKETANSQKSFNAASKSVVIKRREYKQLQ